jgi:hypothetical protein
MEQISNHPLYRSHNIDSAMSSLWEFYKSRFLMLFIISFVMSLVIQYASASTMVNFKELQSITDPSLLLEELKSYVVPILILSLINLLFTTILQYYIIYNPLNSENNILTSAIRSIKYFIPYLIILVLLAFAGSFAILLGLVVLIIGVFFSILYLMTLYLFILPVLMVEGTNIGNAIRRTSTLAHRNFWSNIGWVAVLLIIMIILSVILSAVILLPFSGSFLRSIFNPAEASELIDMTTRPMFIILSAVASAITLPLLPIFAAILYFNARAREDQAQIATTDYPDNNMVSVEDLYAKPYSEDEDENESKENK